MISSLSRYIPSYPIISHHIPSHPIISHHIPSYPIISYHILSYPITSYHILSYPAKPKVFRQPHSFVSFNSCKVICQSSVWCASSLTPIRQEKVLLNQPKRVIWASENRTFSRDVEICWNDWACFTAMFDFLVSRFLLCPLLSQTTVPSSFHTFDMGDSTRICTQLGVSTNFLIFYEYAWALHSPSRLLFVSNVSIL